MSQLKEIEKMIGKQTKILVDFEAGKRNEAEARTALSTIKKQLEFFEKEYQKNLVFLQRSREICEQMEEIIRKN